ncbi:hypothetical protein KBD69_00510 [Candidatus Woesebacteria bacterium]|nr:hypothetical protein [Candidatus Woesebacteria bacterium]
MKKITHKTTKNKENIFIKYVKKNKFLVLSITAFVFIGIYLFTQSVEQASINLVGMGSVTRSTTTTPKTTLNKTTETTQKTGTVTTKPKDGNDVFAGAKLNGGKTEDGAGSTQTAGQNVTTTRTGEKTDNGGAELTRSASGVTTTKTSPKADYGNAFEGANLGGGTTQNTKIVTEAIKYAEEVTGKDLDQNGRVSMPSQEITKSTSGVTPVRPGEKVDDGGAEISKSFVPTSPRTNRDDMQEEQKIKIDAMNAMFDSNVGGGYSGSDGQGNALTSKTETQTLADGGKTVTTTRTIVSPTGNEILISKVEKYDTAGKKIDENTATITKTLNENGKYITNLTNTSGVQTTLYSPDKQSDTFYAPPASNKVPVALKTGADTAGSLSPDKQTEIICPKDTKLVKTRAKGSVCAPTTGSNCGLYAFPLNGKCYPIGDEVTPGNYVCDWTVGGRPNVKYPFLSTNCPTQSATNANEPKSSQECASGDNAGWWDSNAKKCYRPGDHVNKDANTTVQVCTGGYLSKTTSCPEDASTNDATGTLGNDKNSGQFNAPAAPQTGDATGNLGADKNSGQFNAPEECRISWTCEAGEKCSNNNVVYNKGICVPKNPTFSPDKQSETPRLEVETGGSLSPDAVRIVQKPDGKTNQVVEKDTDCKLRGATVNNKGYYICPDEDGSINPELQDKNAQCDVNFLKLEGIGCLARSTVKRLIENVTQPNDSQGLNVDPNLDGNLDGGTKGSEDSEGTQLNTDTLVREGDSCRDANNRNQQGVIKDGVCVSTTR